MKRFAPELDQLMWTLVEQGNDQAIQEFTVRHPECREELAKRKAMVGSLRRAKPEVVSVYQPPPFRPSAEQVRRPVPRWSFAVGGLAIAALGVASFMAGHYLFPAAKPAAESPRNPSPVVRKSGGSQSPPKQLPTVSNAEQPQVDPPNLATPEPIAKVVTLRIASAPLLTVLEAIGAQSNLQIIPAPGMPNADIEADYEGMTAMQILEDLGRQHKFTAFDQGDGTVIVVPAVQEDSPFVSDLAPIRTHSGG